MAIFQSAKVTELEGRVSTLEAENAQLSADLAAANSAGVELEAANARIVELEAANATLTEANAEIPALNQTITEQTAQIVTLTEEAKVTPAKIDLAAAQKLAAMGHGAPLDLNGEKPTGAAPQNIKALTGLSKVVAAFKAGKN